MSGRNRISTAHRTRRCLAPTAIMLMLGLFLPVCAHAQTEGQLAARRTQSVGEYQALLKKLSLSEERRASLAAEIAALRDDQATISAALIKSARAEKELGREIAGIEARLAELRAQEDLLRGSLRSRRGLLAEVLGALQRMGLNPPPAILISPEDALGSVRSAILLGAVVPELRAETEILLADIRELGRIVASIEDEREKLAESVAEQIEEKERLSLLLKEKQRVQGRSERVLAAEQEAAEKLARRAGSLNELIESLETEISQIRAAREAAREAERLRREREAELASLPIPEENRLAGSMPLTALEGKLAPPVVGRAARRFGERDGNGGTAFGDTVKTQSRAIVTAPVDGEVLYAGAFRSYGQLLILNAGGGYHVVLAGMDRINVSLGQMVIAGEPVGAMGESRLASAAGPEDGSNAPELYIEFRKDGTPVDPAPWWAERYSGRTGNDT